MTANTPTPLSAAATHAMDTERLQSSEAALNRFANALERLTATVRTVPGLEQPARALEQRASALRADRFTIVVVGGFNRGKSTLLNAVLGCDILPQSVIPSTAIISLIEWADQPRARVKFLDPKTPEEMLSLDEFRSRYVLDRDDFAQDRIESDRFSKVDFATVGYPVELCRHRVELVDSPGLDDDPVRTKRTVAFLRRADAVVMVLDATTLLTEREVHFLETVLLPHGLKNIFFVINKWNLVPQLGLRSKLEENIAALEDRIHDRLHPFCVVNGKNRSAERIFRIDALGALNARLEDPVDAQLLTESKVADFERSLEQFLVEEKGRARLEIALEHARTAEAEIARFIQAQIALASKSVEEIEAEREALEPKLERLTAICQHIENFLSRQSMNLQDSLVNSFQSEVKKIKEELPESFDETAELSKVFGWTVIGKMATDFAKDDDHKFAARVQRHLQPRITRYLEQRFLRWHESVVQNQIKSVTIDVETHLQEEAKEYRRVMREIEERLGIESQPMVIDQMVQRWLNGSGVAGAAAFDFLGAGFGILGDMAWLIGGIAVDVAMHAALFFVPVVGAVITGIRLLWRESSKRDELRNRIVASIVEQLSELEIKRALEIRKQIESDFSALTEKVTGSISQEIALVRESLDRVIERKTAVVGTAQQEQAKLEAVRTAVNDGIEEMQGLVISARR